MDDRLRDDGMVLHKHKPHPNLIPTPPHRLRTGNTPYSSIYGGFVLWFVHHLTPRHRREIGHVPDKSRDTGYTGLERISPPHHPQIHPFPPPSLLTPSIKYTYNLLQTSLSAHTA